MGALAKEHGPLLIQVNPEGKKGALHSVVYSGRSEKNNTILDPSIKKGGRKEVPDYMLLNPIGDYAVPPLSPIIYRGQE
jgi:hypothetical protein